MLPIAFLEHQSPGRVRLKVPSKRGDPLFFQNVARTLAKHPVVGALKTNPQTGSIVIWHSGDLDAISADAVGGQMFELRPGQSRIVAPRPGRQLSGRGGDIGFLAAAGVTLLGLGFYQAARGRPFGTASEFFWHAYAAHRLLRSPLLTSALMAAGGIQLLRGRVLGPASALLFYAVTTRYLAGAADKDRSPT